MRGRAREKSQKEWLECMHTSEPFLMPLLSLVSLHSGPAIAANCLV